MIQFGLAEGYENRPFHIRYNCSLSSLLRAGVQATGIKLGPIIERIVTQVDGDQALKDNLQTCARENPKDRVMRQIDLRPGKGHPDVLLKVFVMWDVNLEMWQVFVELPFEDVWERGKSNP